MNHQFPVMICRNRPGIDRSAQLRLPSVLSGCVLAFGFAGSAPALEPGLPPGGNFNLSRWKLTLPTAGAPEISAAQLGAGYSNSNYFYTGPDGAMVFWCPVTGGTTSGSSYPRSELRELLVSTNDNVNWSALGTHTLDAQCRILQVPSTKKVIFGQIHAFGEEANPLVKLQYDDGIVEALVKLSPSSGTDAEHPFMPVALNSPITYRLQLENGLLTMTVNGSNRTVNVVQTDPAWAAQGLYFKAGSYCQDNLGTAAEGARVSYYQLQVTHTGNTHIAHQAFDASRKFGFNLLAYDAGTYAIQASSNYFDWTDVFTNAGTGSFNFTDFSPTLSSRRFYRARKLP